MPNGDSGINVALEYYRGARAEIVERLKARDTILLAYLAAVAVLLGIPDKTGLGREYLPFIIPLLGFAAAASIAQHQEIVTTLTVYLAGEWRTSITPIPDPVPPELSVCVRESRPRSFTLTLVTQIAVVVIPSAFSIFVTSPNLNPVAIRVWRRLDWFSLFGLILTIFAAARFWHSKRWREDFIDKHLST